MTAITKHPEEVPPYSITSILYHGTSWIFKEEMENEYKYAYFSRYHMHYSMCILHRLLYKMSD